MIFTNFSWSRHWVLTGQILIAASVALLFLLNVAEVKAEAAPPPSIETRLSTLPSTGAAPLNVMFDAVYASCVSGTPLAVEGTFRVAFGDGASKTLTSCPAGERFFHVYEEAGTYSARLQIRGTASGSSWTNLVNTYVIVTDTPQSNMELSASPSSGDSPLSVTFSHRVPGNTAGAWKIEFGDGSSATATNCYAPTDACLTPGTNTHIYTESGKYTAKLIDDVGRTRAQTSVTVKSTTSTSNSGLSASPSSGDSPLSVTFSHRVPGNTAGAWKIEFGDGSSATATNCYAPTDACLTPGTNTHTYTNPGTYTAKLIDDRGRTLDDVRITVKEEDDEDVSSTLSASPSSGDSPLIVTFSHEFTGRGGDMIIDFGDGDSAKANPCFAPLDACSKPGTNTHTYTKAGKYIARLLQNGTVYGQVTIRVSEEEEEVEEDDELRQQLISLIQALLKQLQTRGTPASFNGTSMVNSSSCVDISNSLYVGVDDQSTNGDVSRLQKFLRATGDFSYPETTGFFGPSTLQAVQQWQTRKGVVSSGTPASTGFGLVGAMTRKAMSCR